MPDDDERAGEQDLQREEQRRLAAAEGEVLLFSTSEEALAGYAKYMSEHTGRSRGRSVTAFTYSEQERLDVEELTHHLNSSCEAIMILMASGSSFLWFSSDDSPRTLELRSCLQGHAIRSLSYVVCPTTTKARKQLDVMHGDLTEVFASSSYAVWHEFSQGDVLPIWCTKKDLCKLVRHPCDQQVDQVEPPLRWKIPRASAWAAGGVLLGVLLFSARLMLHEWRALKSSVLALQSQVATLTEQAAQHAQLEHLVEQSFCFAWLRPSSIEQAGVSS